MNTDTYDRLLEFALREVLREPSSLSLPQRARPAVKRARVLPFAIAAAGIAVVVTIAAWPPRGDALADGDLLVANGDGAFAAARAVPRDAAAWLRDSGSVAVTFANGDVVRLTRGALLANASTPDLLGGEIELLPAPSERRVQTRAGALVVAPNSHVFVRSIPFPDPDSKEAAMRLSDLLSRLHQAPFVLSVTVFAGSADLASAQERVRVVAGETRIVQDPAVARRDAAHAITLFVACNRDVPDAGVLKEQHRELASLLLRSRPPVLALKKDLIATLADANVPDERRGRVAMIACVTDEPTVLDAVAAAFAAKPAAFPFEVTVAMAQRGVPEARTELHRLLQEPQGPGAARAIAALTLGGDNSRRAELRQFCGAPFRETFADSEKFDAKCLAALALAAVGMDAPRRAAVADLETAVTAQLDTPEDVAASADWLRRASYILAQPSPRLDHLDARLAVFTVPGLGDGADAASVREFAANLKKRVEALAAKR